MSRAVEPDDTISLIVTIRPNNWQHLLKHYTGRMKNMSAFI